LKGRNWGRERSTLFTVSGGAANVRLTNMAWVQFMMKQPIPMYRGGPEFLNERSRGLTVLEWQAV
jgi:hypothetical protein